MLHQGEEVSGRWEGERGDRKGADVGFVRAGTGRLYLERKIMIWAYLTNSFSVTDGICTDFSKFDQVNSIFSGCHLAQGYFWTQSMLSTAHFVHTI